VSASVRASAAGWQVGHGRFQTLDLTPLGYRRIADNVPYAERGIV